MSSERETKSSSEGAWLRIPAFLLAVALHAGVGFVYVVSGLVAPIWGVALLLVIWGGLSVVLVRAIQNERPWPALAVPLAGAAAWFAVVQGLGTLFDWTA